MRRLHAARDALRSRAVDANPQQEMVMAEGLGHAGCSTARDGPCHRGSRQAARGDPTPHVGRRHWPGTDLAILNYIANYIIHTGAAKRDFVDKHCNIRMANTDIGYGLRPEHVLEQRAQHANDAQVSHPSDFEAYAKLMAE